MKRILYILSILLSFAITVTAQKRNNFGTVPGYIYVPYYQHKSNLPSISNPPTLAIVADSVGSTTVPTGMYEIDTVGQHAFIANSGGGGGGMTIGGTVTSGTQGSALFIGASSVLAQDNANYFWDDANIGLGIGNNSIHADLDVYHNESGSQFAGLMLERIYNGNSQPVIHITSGRGTRSSPLEPNAGDSAGRFQFEKYNGASFQPIATEQVLLVGTPATTNIRSAFVFATDSVGTPSVLKPALYIDDQQTTNIRHLFVSPTGFTPTPTYGYSLNGNAGYSLMEIFGPNPNLPYAGHLAFTDNSGVAAGNGGQILFNVQTGASTFVGAGKINGYKSNSTAGDYSGGIFIQTRLNGNLQADAIRWNELQHTLVGGLTADSAAWIQIQAANATTSQLYLKPTAVDPTSPKNGSLWYDSLTNALNFEHNGTLTNILSGGGASQTYQQVLTTGSTLTGTNNVINTGQTFTWTNGGTGLWKWSGLSHDTANTVGLMMMGNDSSLRMGTWASVAAKIAPNLPTYNIYFANGLTGAGGDSAYLGGTLNQNTTLTTGSDLFTFANVSGGVGYTGGGQRYNQVVSNINGDYRSIFGWTNSSGSFTRGDGIQVDTLNDVILGSNGFTSANFSTLYGNVGSPSIFVSSVITGAQFKQVTNPSSATTINVNLTEHTILIDATSGNVVVNIPAANTAFVGGFGIEYVIQKKDASANTVTITANGSDLINGSSTVVLSTQYQTKTVQCVSSSAWTDY